MFFILRCIFWLGLVFYNMNWSTGAATPQPHVAALPEIRHVATTAGEKLHGFCRNHASDCLGALIAASAVTNRVLHASAPAPASNSARGTRSHAAAQNADARHGRGAAG